MNALLIHGWNTRDEYFDPSRPTASNDHWFPWLSKQLILKDINTVSIEMPNGYYPEYGVWKRELERYDIDSDTILVGHSCGGGFLVRWLSETKKRVGTVVLVAPWLGLDPGDEPFDTTFFNFDIDPTISSRTRKLVIYNSADDMESVQKSVEMLQAGLEGAIFKDFADKGHFTLKGLGTEEFPELLTDLVG